MKRSQITLGAALLLQLGLILVFRSPLSGSTGAPERRALFPVLEAISPVKLELGGSDEKPLTLEKKGDEWAVTDLGGFPADGEKVSRVLEEIESLTVGRPIVSKSRYHESFHVTDKDNEGRIRLWDADGGDPKVDLIIGDSPNYRITHVRLASDDEVYEARGLTSYDVRAASASWIRKELLDAAIDKVVSLALTNAAGSFELEKADGSWKIVGPESLAGRALDAQKVEDLVRSVTSLRLADAVGPRADEAQGLARPAATVVVRWTPEGVEPGAGETPADLEEATLQIGGTLADNDSQRYVGRAGFAFTGAIWDSSVKKLIEGTLDDLSAS